MQIIVNGDKINVAPEDRISYEAVAALAGHPGARELTMTYYWRGPEDMTRSGILIRGETVALAEGMQFNACYTGNA